ncbi:MAG: hypothetical protein ACJZ4G_03985 [Candidatus Pelagibacter sp.]
MIFFLGCISVVQILFIPGIIIKKLSRIDDTKIFNLIFIILTSIFANYFIITFLIFLKIYTQEVLAIIIAFEIIFALILLNYNNQIINTRITINIIVVIFVFLLILFALIKNTGNVFYSWDAVVSYNEWAINFSNNDYPQSMIRPYLMPKLWSLTYVLTNSEIEFFAKFTTAVFPIIILLICLDNILKHKKISNYIYLFLFCLFFYFQRNFILTGYVDTPLIAIVTSFFFFSSKSEDIKNITPQIISILLSFGIKISGIFILFYFIFVTKKYFKIKFFIIVILSLYFFLLYFNTFNNFFSSNIFNEMGQLDNFNFLRSLNYSLYLLRENHLLIFLLLALFGAFLIETRKILFLFIIPSMIYWVIFLSYDIRNMLYVIPAIFLINSIIIEKILLKFNTFNKLFNKILSIQTNKNFLFIINKKLIYLTFLFLVIVFSYIFNDEKIKYNNVLKKNEMRGNYEINLEIAKLIKQNKINTENFMTDFQLIFYTPMFDEIFSWDKNYINDNKNFNNYDYFLVYGHQKELRNFIKKKLNNNDFKIIRDINNFILVGKQ